MAMIWTRSSPESILGTSLELATLYGCRAPWSRSCVWCSGIGNNWNWEFRETSVKVCVDITNGSLSLCFGKMRCMRFEIFTTQSVRGRRAKRIQDSNPADLIGGFASGTSDCRIVVKCTMMWTRAGVSARKVFLFRDLTLVYHQWGNHAVNWRAVLWKLYPTSSRLRTGDSAEFSTSSMTTLQICPTMVPCDRHFITMIVEARNVQICKRNENVGENITNAKTRHAAKPILSCINSYEHSVVDYTLECPDPR